VRQTLLPVRRYEPGVGDGIDVVGKGQRHDISLEALDHGAGLLAGAAVRLVDGDGVAGLGLPVFGESIVELLIELPGRVVGDVQQGDVGRDSAAGKQGAGQQAGEKTFSFMGTPFSEGARSLGKRCWRQ
jgi:hypothetical protein